jgi:hypothetical protein
MGREKLLKLSDREHDLLETAMFLVKQLGVSTFSKEAQSCVENGCKGSYVGLGCQLIIEHFKVAFPSPTEKILRNYDGAIETHA